MGAASARRASIFVSHKIARHKAAARRIKAILESRAELLDVHICEQARGGDRIKKWVIDRISQSQMLLVLWPRAEPGLNLKWIADEIDQFQQAHPDGRLIVVKHESDQLPSSVGDDTVVVNASSEQLSEILLEPLYRDASFLGIGRALNPRVSSDDIQHDAEQIRQAFLGTAKTHTRSYRGLFVVAINHTNAAGLDAATVQASGCEQMLSWDKRRFSWRELRAHADQENAKGTFWVTEMERVIDEVARGNIPPVMTSTFRGRSEAAAGQIFRPHLERVDFNDDAPIRYYFGFYKVLVPELVRGPNQIGAVFNLLHVSARVRWEVLNPFLVNLILSKAQSLQHFSREERDKVIAQVSGSLRVIELEAERHHMLESASDWFAGADLEQITRMHHERDSIRHAMTAAAERNDFDGLMETLTCALQLNCDVTELLAGKFLQLVRDDRKDIAERIGERTTLVDAARPSGMLLETG